MTANQRELAVWRLRRWVAFWGDGELELLADDDQLPAILREACAFEIQARIAATVTGCP